MVLPSIRHSRAGGNPGLFSRPISLDTRFRGYDGTRAASSFCRSSLHTYFQRRHEGHEVYDHIYFRNLCALRVLSGEYSPTVNPE